MKKNKVDIEEGDFKGMVLKELKKLSDKVDKIDIDDDLELSFISPNNNQSHHSQMLNISHSEVDSFGDSIELTTKSRLENNRESFQVAYAIVSREYHNMTGNRYGKHSKYIPVIGRDGKRNKLDTMWFSGGDIKIVTIKGIEYYKIRLLFYDMLVKKLLLSRIPTNNGGARQEEINLAAARNIGNQKLATESSNVQPMKPIEYGKTDDHNKDSESIYDH